MNAMLVSFRIKNFLSFFTDNDGSPVEFSMIAGKAKNKQDHILETKGMDLLRFSALFGANASGKTNLVKAMSFFQQTVVNGMVPTGSMRMFCRQRPENAKIPSYFEMEICLDGHYYTYGFEVLFMKNAFVSEWLVESFSGGKEDVLFERDIEKGKNELAKKYVQKASVYLEDIRKDSTALYLKAMNQNKVSFYQENPGYVLFQNLYNWFTNALDINYPDRPVSTHDFFMSEDVSNICRAMEQFSTGITDFQLVEVSMERAFASLPLEFKSLLASSIEQESIKCRTSLHNGKKHQSTSVIRSPGELFIIEFDEIKKQMVTKAVQFKHGPTSSWYDFGEESDGMVRLFDLLKILLTKQQNKVFVVDELDRCLHPCLTYRFVQEFFHETAQKKNIQLIVTAQESRLMDFDLLRRDEMWIANRKADGTSELYSLEEYNIRNDLKVDKAYLDGRYGGVPLFTTLFPIEGTNAG